MTNKTQTIQYTRRAQVSRAAVASVRAEGLKPSKAFLQRVEQYNTGKISAAQLDSQTLADVKSKSK